MPTVLHRMCGSGGGHGASRLCPPYAGKYRRTQKYNECRPGVRGDVCLSIVIARSEATKQSRVVGFALDFFASLAMTDTGDFASLLRADRRQVLEPVLGLDEALHLGRQRVRVGVVHHPDQHGVVDDGGVGLRDQLVLLRRIERLLGL